MNALPETQLGEELRQIVADPPFVPDLEAIERRGGQRRRRGYVIRALAGATGLGVVLAGVLVAGSHATASSHATAGTAAAAKNAKIARTDPPATPPAQTVAYVRKEIAAAFSPGNFLVETRENTSSVGTPTTMITIWTDPRTGNTMLLQGSGNSRLTYWEHDYFDSNRVLHWDQTQVNYGPRTWWTYNEHAAGPIQGSVPSGPIGGNEDTPQEITQLLAHGAKIVGYPYVDGHHTVELVVSMGAGGKFEIWADAHTYQVVRMVKYFPTALNAPPIVANYTWARRSATLAYLINHPDIPAGFTQVSVGG
jgi:hypothetical protein